MSELAFFEITATGRKAPRLPVLTKEGNLDRFWSPQRILQIQGRAHTGEPLIENLRIARPLTTGVPTPQERLFLKRIDKGKKPDSVDLSVFIGKQLNYPAWRGSWSYGACTHWTHLGAAESEARRDGYLGIGEGGVHPAVRKYGKIIIPQVASGLFVDISDLEKAAAIEDKFAQNSKIGRGGARKKKWSKRREAELAAVRGLPADLDTILSPPNFNISVEEGVDLVSKKREINPNAFQIAKGASILDIDQIVLQFYRAGYNAVDIDCLGGGTASSQAEWRDFCGGAHNIFAARKAYLAAKELGIENIFPIILSARMATARDAYLMIRAGATAVLRGTESLIAMDCVWAQNCSHKCPVYITTYPDEEFDTPELEQQVVSTYTSRLVNDDRTFQIELAQYVAWGGHSSILEARGDMNGIDGILSPKEAQILGISNSKTFYMPLMSSGNSDVEQKRDGQKRQSGKAIDGAMGTSRDVQSKQTIFDAIRAARPPFWVSPSYDYPSERIATETTVGSAQGWGGIVTKNKNRFAEYFGILNLGEIKEEKISIKFESEVDNLLSMIKTDQKLVVTVEDSGNDIEKLATLSNLDRKLRETVVDGKILRENISILVEGEHLRPNEFAVYECLGADAVLMDLPEDEATLNQLSATVAQENQEFLGALGLKGRKGRIGARELIAVDPSLDPKIVEELGLEWFE